MGISFEGLMRFYQDCKLRSSDLAPHHLEALFSEHAGAAAADHTLAPAGFVELLVQFANLRFRGMIDGLNDQLTCLIEHHLKPFACQRHECLFQRVSHDPQVRRVLEENGAELHMVFQLYRQFEATDEAGNTMSKEEFMMLLAHCNMIDGSHETPHGEKAGGVFTDAAARDLFQGIQCSAYGVDMERGFDVNDELAYSEFLDGLVAITAFKFPDPFRPFHERVAALIVEIFTRLRKYWSRNRTTQRTDELLNALQKKLR